MKYSEQSLLNCLERRKEWYTKSIAIITNQIPHENNWDFPYGTVDRWKGAELELMNTIAMIKTKDVY